RQRSQTIARHPDRRQKERMRRMYSFVGELVARQWSQRVPAPAQHPATRFVRKDVAKAGEPGVNNTVRQHQGRALPADPGVERICRPVSEFASRRYMSAMHDVCQRRQTDGVQKISWNVIYVSVGD